MTTSDSSMDYTGYDAGRRDDAKRHDGASPIETGRTRLLIAGVLFALAFLLIAARLIDIAVFQDAAEPTLPSETPGAAMKIGRADIYDRNGLLLATSLTVPSLYADPAKVLDPKAAARAISSVLPDLNAVETEAKLKTDRRFVWLKRNLTPAQQFKVNALGVPGIYFQNESRRIYPHGALVAHAIGFTDVDGVGLAGVERSFDQVLRDGTDPLHLSLDLRIQHIVREELRAQIEAFEGIGGVGVVLDAHTSEAIAMVSLPDFDPNNPGITPDDARFNRATLGVYEMGSTFKIFNTAMALDLGTATVKSGYDATKPIKIARFTINDYHPQRRWLTVPEILLHSSNIGSVLMALDVGTERQRAFMDKIGFLSPLSIEVPERGAPQSPSTWRKINTMTISFGHGLSVSPMHLASGVASVLNGGIKRPVTLLRQPAGQEIPGERVIKTETSLAMRRMLRLVVEAGTGKNASAEGYLVGGKTGTAEKPGAGGAYKKKSLLSSFVAAFPIHDPRYVVLIMVDEPKGQKFSHGYATGGWVAAPAVKRIIARAAPLLGIHPIDEKAPEISRVLAIQSPDGGLGRLASF